MSMSFSRKKPPFNPPATNGFASQSTQQLRPVCTWSAYAPQSGPSPVPFPRSGHTLTATATAAPLGELYLFGGYVHGRASSDLYVFSTLDLSTTLLQTSGEVPIARAAHGAALIGTTLLICGGKTDVGDQYVLNHDSLYLLNLVLREWTRVGVTGFGPGCRYYHTATVVGSKFFVFGGQIDRNFLNDMWALDLNSLKSQPVWESYEPSPGNENPLPRARHVSVTTEDRIIIFGGTGNQHDYNDTWSFDILTRKWTELQCTGSIPSPRASHAAVLVDDVMYVFGGFSVDEGYLDDLYSLQLSTQRWFKFHNAGPSPHGRSAHTMASDGTRVFVLGGYSKGARADEISLIHVFDTKDINYPEPERNAVNPYEKPTQLVRRSFTGPPTLEQPQHLRSLSMDAYGTSRLQNATTVSGRPASLQIIHERNSGPNGRPPELTSVKSKPNRVLEADVGEGSTEYHAKSAVSPSSTSLEHERITQLEQQLSVSLAAQTERDERIARLNDELARKSALLKRAEANAEEAARGAGPELCEHADDRRLVKQRDAKLMDVQAKLDELVLFCDQQAGQYEQELTNVRAQLEKKESELEAVRLRLMDAEKGLAKSKTEADTLRAQTATGPVNRDDDQVTRRLIERVRAIEAEMASKRWDEKSFESMECSNEG